MSRSKTLAAGLSFVMLFISMVAYADDVGSEPVMVREAYDDSAEAIKQRAGSGDPLAGMRKSFLCQGCHGTDGISVEPLIPKLAGQYANYIEKQIHNYQAGTRSHQIMNGMAATVENDTDLADIAAYFASQPKMEGDGSPGNPLGESIFLHGDISKNRLPCFGCHGIRGKGDAPTSSMFPVIGGQQKEYIRKQLMDFRSGIRTNSPAGIMNLMAKLLTDEEIDALADYISAQ
ncbi:MAG: c-type cytochrome [Gallionellaceae bacterium]